MPVPDLNLVESMFRDARQEGVGVPTYGEEEILEVLWRVASFYLDDNEVVKRAAEHIGTLRPELRELADQAFVTFQRQAREHFPQAYMDS